MQLAHIPSESNNNTVLHISKRLMAYPLFRIHDPNLAGWKTGSNKFVGLKMAVQKDKNSFVLPAGPRPGLFVKHFSQCQREEEDMQETYLQLDRFANSEDT